MGDMFGQESGNDPAVPSSTSNEESNNVQKITDEFQYLLEKSQQLFAGLRDLPPTGGQKQWQPYFQRTFEVYTKLWKFQQIHRQTLEGKDSYGLKRWEIGEIASKIGQLYYHYYLRTSETNYLQESYVFYDAIRQRNYFKDVLETKNAALVIKKLRYYARFVVVCLLLNKKDSVRTLLEELTTLVDDYTKAFKPLDSQEWQVVLSEIVSFMEAEKKISPVDNSGHFMANPNSRLNQERSSTHGGMIASKFEGDRLKLQEAVLVGNYTNQIKFSELTLDMYRMLQSLEREPVAPSAVANSEKQSDESVESGAQNHQAQGVVRRSNPHKYLLYRPTISQLLVFLATAFKEVVDHQVLMLYISADGLRRIDEGNHLSVYSGGVVTGSRRSPERPEAEAIHCLHPGDIIPFSRKALFVIVDSGNASAFKSFPKVFIQPFLVLMSPSEYPQSIKDHSQVGSIFTLFLHSPLNAFCLISSVNTIGQEAWSRSLTLIERAEDRALELLFSTADIDKAYTRFATDDFLRSFICRFIFCAATLRMNSNFSSSEKFQPSAQPTLPSVILEDGQLSAHIGELAEALGVAGQYAVPEAIPNAAEAVVEAKPEILNS